jgi:hypothetical protein
MAASASSFADAMTKVLSDLGAALALPDADPKFIIQLQTAITGRLKQGQGGPPGQGQPPPGPGQGGPPPGLSMPGAPSGGGPGGAPNPAGQSLAAPHFGGSVTAGPGSPGTTNADEMRRMIQQQTA